MKAREIIHDIREKFKLTTDDIDITDEYLFHLVNVKRVFFLKQRFSKTSRNIPEEVKQIICVPLEQIDDVEGICDINTKLLRSTVRIPSTIEIGGRSALINVRVPQVTARHLNIVPIERFPHIGYNKYLKDMIYVSMDADNKIYVKTTDGPSLMENLKVTALFANPEEAYDLSCEDNTGCDFLDSEYPVEAYIVSDMVNAIARELAPTMSIPEDNLNNADETNR